MSKKQKTPESLVCVGLDSIISYPWASAVKEANRPPLRLKQPSSTKSARLFYLRGIDGAGPVQPRDKLLKLQCQLGEQDSREFQGKPWGYRKPGGRIMSHCQRQQSLTSSWTPLSQAAEN